MQIGSNGWNTSVAGLSNDRTGFRAGTSLDPGTPYAFRYSTGTGMWLDDQAVQECQPGDLPADRPVPELHLQREHRADFELRIGRVQTQPLLRLLAVVSASVFAALVLAGIIVWWLARLTGTLASINSFVGSAVGVDGFELSGAAVLSAWMILAAMVAAAGGVALAVMGPIYNRAAEMVGGIVLEGSLARSWEEPSGSRREPISSDPSSRNEQVVSFPVLSTQAGLAGGTPQPVA